MTRLVAYGSSPIKEDFAFPAQIAQHLDREYVSRVKPLNSNHKLARQILSQTYESSDLVLVDWATTVRHEFRTEHGWMTTSLVDRPSSEFETVWYQGPGKWEYTPVYSALKEIVLVQTFFKAQGLRYVFTFDYDDIILSTLLTDSDEYIGTLKDMIDWTRVVLFEGHGFLWWAKEKQFAIDGGHAEPAAHDCAAEYLLNAFEF
jgi:hypothetical protein